MSCPECGFAGDEANESQPVCPACSAAEPGFTPEEEWDEELGAWFEQASAEEDAVPQQREPA